MKDIFQVCVFKCVLVLNIPISWKSKELMSVQATKIAMPLQLWEESYFASLSAHTKILQPVALPSKKKRVVFVGWQFPKGFEVIMVCAVGSHDPIYHEPWCFLHTLMTSRLLASGCGTHPRVP